MLIESSDWLRIAEINPPELPNLQHRSLSPSWSHVLVTDNVFGRIRVSPYAFSARITHDTPDVHPTVVVSTRDRNILAIESEVRGALGNGVDSFLVVIGDTVPHVDHLAHHYEIVEHLTELQENLPDFEVGMPTRFREWQFRPGACLSRHDAPPGGEGQCAQHHQDAAPDAHAVRHAPPPRCHCPWPGPRRG